MISESIIKTDLENIKYYSVRKYVLNPYFNTFAENDIVALTEKYNNAMKSAPIKLYHLYVLRYLKGCTQEDIANEMGFTHTTIHSMHNTLIEWLCKNIQENDQIKNLKEEL